MRMLHDHECPHDCDCSDDCECHNYCNSSECIEEFNHDYCEYIEECEGDEGCIGECTFDEELPVAHELCVVGSQCEVVEGRWVVVYFERFLLYWTDGAYYSSTTDGGDQQGRLVYWVTFNTCYRETGEVMMHYSRVGY
jgi:hypothetical protein